jgi:hypothetical protein
MRCVQITHLHWWTPICRQPRRKRLRIPRLHKDRAGPSELAH